MEYITEPMRRKAFAMMGEMLNQYEPPVSNKTLDGPKLTVGTFYNAVIKGLYANACDYEISLKTGACTVEEYDRFIGFLFELAMDAGMQFSQSPMQYFESTDKYLILCIKNRVCCLTGTPNADIHHCDCIGMGNNRNDADNSKIPRMALSRKKHQECGQIGQDAFDRKYHVHGVLCGYHNDVWDDEEPTLIPAHQNIKTMRYSDEKRLLGVQFKSPVLGCNEKGVIVYRMEPEEYAGMMNQPEPMAWFMNEVYGQREIVDI